MWNQVGGKFQRDESVDADATTFGQIEQAAGKHMIQNAFGRVPLKRNGNDFHLMACVANGISQLFGMDLGPSVREGDLHGSDDNSHLIRHGCPYEGPTAMMA
jgi:hypothetical protein